MRKTQQIQLKINEIRSEIDAAIEAVQKSGKAPDKETQEQIASLRNQHVMNCELLAAAQIGEEAEERSDTDTTHTIERRNIVDQATLARFTAAASTGKPLDGVEAEVRAELLKDTPHGDNHVPMELLLPAGFREENRADAATNLSAVAGPTNTRNIIARIFEGTVADYLGVSMPAVGAGTAAFPILTGGTSASMKAAGASVDALAATVGVKNITPGRLTARYKFRVEDTVKFADLEEALRRDIRAAMRDQLDEQILNGNGTAPNMNGFLNNLPAAAAASTTVDWAGFPAILDALIDGTYATMPSDLKMLIGTATYQKAASLYQANTTVSAYDYTSAKFGGLRTSSRMPDAAANVQTALVAKNLPDGRETATAPVWRAFEMIRDPYTGAASGEIAMTALTLFGFEVIRPEAFRLVKYKLA